MNKNWVLAVAAVAAACAGLAINILFDRDNIYDMTLMALWTASLALAIASTFLSRKASHYVAH